METAAGRRQPALTFRSELHPLPTPHAPDSSNSGTGYGSCFGAVHEENLCSPDRRSRRVWPLGQQFLGKIDGGSSSEFSDGGADLMSGSSSECGPGSNGVYACVYLIGSCSTPGLRCFCWEKGTMVCAENHQWELVPDGSECPATEPGGSYDGHGCLPGVPTCSDLGDPPCTCDPQTKTYQCPAKANTNADVTCGTATCSSSTNVCCSHDTTSTGTCIGPSDVCISKKFLCDDPSDCSAGDVCCIVSNWATIASLCLSPAACTNHLGLVGCQSPSDCNGQGTLATCCNNAPASHCCMI
jgi:hypothetical protein